MGGEPLLLPGPHSHPEWRSSLSFQTTTATGQNHACMAGGGARSQSIQSEMFCLVRPPRRSAACSSIMSRLIPWPGFGRIWERSEAFNRFRGTEWMPTPCRDCGLREADFGGCRCQAALITGRPDVTDPVCSLSPNRNQLASFVDSVQQGVLGARCEDGLAHGVVFRQNPVIRSTAVP